MAGRLPRALRALLAQHAGKTSVVALSTAFAFGVVVGQERGFAADMPTLQSQQPCAPPFTVTHQQALLPDSLRRIVGPKHVAERVVQQGSRLGQGTALAVVSPGTLQEAVDVLKACVRAGVAVIPQGANTGLTGGSVPRDKEGDRPVVVLNMRRLSAIVPLAQGQLVLCLAGAGILDLSNKLRYLGRECHTELGSIFLNPSVAAGISFGSGGTQLRKGPVYTERVLYAKVTDAGDVQIVDELGILNKGTEDLFTKLQSGQLADADLDPACRRVASDTAYRTSVCRFDSNVSRFNADTRGPDPCRCEGKVLILASIHDTFPIPQRTEVYWVACKDFQTAQKVKREVYLKDPSVLPSALEYMNRDTVDVTDSAGRGFTTTINSFGMETLGPLWTLKLRIQALPLPLADRICDLLLWYTNNLLPKPLSAPLAELSKQWDHHLLVEVPEFGRGEVTAMEKRFLDWVRGQPAGSVAWHRCSPEEKKWAMVFRFVNAAAFKTYCVGRGFQGLSLDYSLPKAEASIPPMPDPQPLVRMRYSHFGCNVVHEDLAYGAGVDTHAAKFRIKGVVEGMQGKLPAEHGHGTEYTAPADTQARWMRMDPTNSMNPGVGGLSYFFRYKQSD